MPHPQEIEDQAERLYTVYCHAVGGKAYDGRPLPAWAEFSTDPGKQTQANGWRALGEMESNREARLVQEADDGHTECEQRAMSVVGEGEEEMNDLIPEEIAELTAINSREEWSDCDVVRLIELMRLNLDPLLSALKDRDELLEELECRETASEAAQKRIAELEGAGDQLLTFAVAYSTHHLRNQDDKLGEALDRWNALKGGAR